MSKGTLKLAPPVPYMHGGAIAVGRHTDRTNRPIGFCTDRAEPTAQRGGIIEADSGAGLVTIAGTGSGKGVSQVIPTLLTYLGSIIVTDPKGELYAVTARRRAQMGQRVIRIDPFGAAGTDAINPLERVSAVSRTAIDDCTRIATQLLPRNAADRDPFWNQGAVRMVAGSLLFIATHLSPSLRNLRSLRKIWLSSEEDRVVFMACARGSSAHDGIISEAASMYVDSPDRTRGSFLATIREGLGFLQSSASLDGLMGKTLDLDDYIAGVPMTIYLTIPPHYLASHGKLLRLWLGTLINAATQRRRRPAIPDLLLIDEAAQPGRLEELRAAATLLRGYGVRTWTFWQSLAQLQSTYGESWMEFLDNAGTISIFGTANAASAAVAREVTGYQGEILGMPRGEQLLVRSGAVAERVGLISYLEDPEYTGLWDSNPLHRRAGVTTAPRQPLPPRHAVAAD